MSWRRRKGRSKRGAVSTARLHLRGPHCGNTVSTQREKNRASMHVLVASIPNAIVTWSCATPICLGISTVAGVIGRVQTFLRTYGITGVVFERPSGVDVTALRA